MSYFTSTVKKEKDYVLTDHLLKKAIRSTKHYLVCFSFLLIVETFILKIDLCWCYQYFDFII